MAELIRIEQNKLHPTLAALSEAGATTEDADWIRKPGNADLLVRFMHGKQAVQSSEGGETITVPDLPAAELIALAQHSLEEAGIPFTYFNPDLRAWNFLLDERGKTFQVFTHCFGRDWEAHEARTWQRSVGADGNVAAFIAWVIAKKPMGWFVSIPNDDARLWRHPVYGGLFAPSFDRYDGSRHFGLGDVRGEWSGVRSVVAFRAI